MEVICKSQDETKELAREFVLNLAPREDGAVVLALRGDLGSGKTAFTQYVAEALGVEDIVTSPTFVIEKRYLLLDQKFERLIHIDAYRLEKDEDLESLNWDKLLKNPKNLVVVEWSERVSGAIPENAKKLSFDTVDENTRCITLD